ncbi:related to Cut9 interacting protein scn1 [Serendipita indica DSM 11827]|uniref:Related to Cut9 interacting protein scn1 n=1 Tax=Serendipita indica (strain DSM 11827) TaxID=1109443 RepID=G4T7B2_SERID|nr:related to Cut9 interacting protein scn1 [Serendipita indica DSM 11827]
MSTTLPPREVLAHLVDVHCHPTEELNISDEVMRALPIRLCSMSSNFDDQDKVEDLYNGYPDKVIPCFGFHPWFYHEISLVEPVPSKEDHYRSLFLQPGSAKEGELDRLVPLLREPVALSKVIQIVKEKLLKYPNAMVGEVGLDKSFRIAYNPYPAPPPRKLSPFSTPLSHQMVILEAQLRLAVELKRNVSLHSVGAQQPTVELLQRMSQNYGKDWLRISVDMHSCGLSADVWKTKAHANIFLSLSTAINSRSDKHRQLIRECDEHRLLAESDYPEAGMCASQTWSMVETIADIRQWPVETEWDEKEPDPGNWGVVRRLERNWAQFCKGDHPEIVHKSRRLRKQHEHYPSDESTEEDE